MKLNSMIYAGAWYPDDPQQLKAIFRAAESHCGFTVKNSSAAILPHAGLYYSARGMLPFFKSLSENIDLVIILAPSHYYHLENDALYYGDFSAYQTPAGNLKAASVSFLESAGDSICEFSDPVLEEHAVEMFLPAIKMYCPEDVQVSALLSGFVTDLKLAEKNADLLINYAESICGFDRTAIIASSDFTHYGSRFNYTPFDQSEASTKVREQDLEVARLLAEGSSESVFRYISEHNHTICGINPALILKIIMEKKGLTGVVSDYYNSNDVTGSLDSSFVSYCSVLFSKIAD